MAYVTMNLNAAATAQLAGATKLRVRIQDGKVQIRPTDRASAVNLPKGESLRAVSRKNASTVKFGMGGTELTPGTKLVPVAAKYGWFTLEAVEELAQGTPAVRVSAN